ncbi:MAG: hypothetical protein K1X71_06835 [Pirellulales bacterium]|nr:hypothetical protein [Pirellulales bacterium]
MGGLISKLGAGVSYFAVATVLAAITLVVIGFSTGTLNEAKLARLRAVLVGTEAQAPKARPDEAKETPSYEELLERRSVKFRELELREEVVRQNVSILTRERLDVTARRDELTRIQQAFQAELAQMADAALVAGEENVRLTFERMRPPQARQQLLLMLEQGELENVVAMLAAMPIERRAKIVAEFKSPEDLPRLNEILEVMGQGDPVARMVDETRGAMSQAASQP